MIIVPAKSMSQDRLRRPSAGYRRRRSWALRAFSREQRAHTV